METLVLPGNLKSLSEIGQYIMKVAEEVGLEKKSAYKLRLAVDEIATNIIIHGYKENDLDGNITIKNEVKKNQLVITLEDTAVAFDPIKHEFEHDLSLPLEERPIGGLGVFLAADGIDDFLYEREDNRNKNIFIMNLD